MYQKKNFTLKSFTIKNISGYLWHLISARNGTQCFSKSSFYELSPFPFYLHKPYGWHLCIFFQMPPMLHFQSGNVLLEKIYFPFTAIKTVVMNALLSLIWECLNSKEWKGRQTWDGNYFKQQTARGKKIEIY